LSVRAANESPPSRIEAKTSPPGRARILTALKALLKEKEFSAITWADIARTAGVNEGLIYRYFKDSRNLLHEALREYLEPYVALVERDTKGIEGVYNKLRRLIWSHFDIYHSDRVFARILLLEVRNYPGYFQSDTYRLVKRYAKIILDIIQEGVDKGEIRDDISPRLLMQAVLGCMEHFCLPAIIFGREMRPDHLTEELCKILFEGSMKGGRK
jgi:TetR/AcrR family transcriptional regulator, fatty acid metabolism regulator protein